MNYPRTLRKLRARAAPARSFDPNGAPRAHEQPSALLIQAAIETAGLPAVSFHSLSDVVNSVLFSEGESPKSFAERLSHSTTRLTCC